MRGASAKMKENELQKENSFSLKMLSLARKLLNPYGTDEQSSMKQHADIQLAPLFFCFWFFLLAEVFGQIHDVVAIRKL